ncbi:hypothetical protein LTR86_004324 [Recurvomyces mirabilis]|nr:hypothetical protein LTR86_004324 [Recurvomyces mirabilis]
MATQRALLVQRIGDPLSVVDNHSIPTPGPGQLQIKVTVAGLNPHDQRSRDTGLLIADKLPAILAKDVVGTVSRVGEGVIGFQVGDSVLSLGSGTVMDSSQSGLQQYSLADIENCTKTPDNLSDDEAATIPTNVSAVFGAYCEVLGLPTPWQVQAKGASPPEHLLIVGGGANCGKFGVQLAKLIKTPTIIVVGGDEMDLKARGATHFIDRHQSEDAIAEQVRDITSDKLVYALDAVNWPQDLGLALKAMSSHRKGKLARLVPIGQVEDLRGHELLDVLGNFFYRNPLCIEFWQRHLTGYLRDGAISPTSFSTREGLESANAALDEYRDGKNKAKPQIRL